eukprot:1343595-Pyramimonas_sp.AAC.1
MRLGVEPDFLHAGVADASPHASAMCRRCIGAAVRSSDPIYSDPIWEASIHDSKSESGQLR